MVAFDEGQLSSYWEYIYKGDDRHTQMLIDINVVFPASTNTKATVVADDTYILDKVKYHQVRNMEGEKSGKLVWVLNISMEPIQMPQPVPSQ